MSAAELLRMEGISKSFPGVKALRGVSLRLDQGEVLGVCGENGAGKSTLMKILSGIYQAETGEIRFAGQPVKISSPRHAEGLGIAIVHQELNLVPHLTVAENILMGRIPSRMGIVSKSAMFRRAAELLAEIGFDLNPHAAARDLGIGQQQAVELVKSLSTEARIVIMDEPTAALSPDEADKLFEVIERLRHRGIGIIYISHRLEEVMAITDRIVVLRDGEMVGERKTTDTTIPEIVNLMVGRKVENLFDHESTVRSEVLLEVQGLSRDGRVYDVSFSLRRGEVVGIAGLMGSGRTELLEAIYGAAPRSAGKVRVAGDQVAAASPYDAISKGMVFLPEDRKTQALMLSQSIRKNITLPILSRLKGLFGTVAVGREMSLVEDLSRQLKVKAPSSETVVQGLSGGNQQKVVLAKWIGTKPKVLLLDEPTRGIDVGAKAEIYELIRRLAADGAGVVLVSSELPEVLGLSDRVLVMNKGRVAAEFDRADATPDSVMLAATR
ncbi:MAG: rbsA [Firmicutes bacterium]|nr:rbsA [Bacillota bacterium]